MMIGGGDAGVAQRLDKIMRSKISPCIFSCRVVRGPPRTPPPPARPGGNFENQECRRCHLGSFCNAIKVSNLPECLFADVSEEKVPIYSMLVNVIEAGRACSVGCANILASRRLRVRSSRPAHSFVEIWS